MPIKLRNVKVNFQNTLWVGEKPPANIASRLLARLLEPFPKELSYVVNNLYRADSNSLEFVCDYYQPKFERITDDRSLLQLESEGYEISVNPNKNRALVGFTKDKGKSWLYLAHGYEIFAYEGHVLALGLPTKALRFKEGEWDYPGLRLTEKLSQLEDYNFLRIAAHPLAELSILQRVILRSLREPSKYFGLTEQFIKEHAKEFDALEGYSLSMTPTQIKRVRDLSRELGLPLVCSSDTGISDYAREIYTLLQEIDFSSIEKVNESIRSQLKLGNIFLHISNQIPKRQLVNERLRHLLLNVAGTTMFGGRKNF